MKAELREAKRNSESFRSPQPWKAITPPQPDGVMWRVVASEPADGCSRGQWAAHLEDTARGTQPPSESWTGTEAGEVEISTW